MNPLLAKYRCQDAQDINQYSPQILAYIGDAVYELCIRMRNTSSPFVNANRVHEETVEKVNAVFQAQLITTLTPYLTEKEQHVVRRGKNIKIQQQHEIGCKNFRNLFFRTRNCSILK